MFQEGKLKAENKRAIKEFSEKYIVSEKLVADYIKHLTDIEIRKDKRRTDNDRNQLSSLTIGFWLSQKPVVIPLSRWTWTLY